MSGASPPPRKRLFGDISVLQVMAGALAAMTSAWIASYLGVGGTIIGAAIGSIVASTSTAIYLNTLRQGHTIIVTDRGTVIEQPGEQSGELSDESDQPVVEKRPYNWRLIIVAALATFGLALAGVIGYEAVTGGSFGPGDNRPLVQQPGPAATTEPTPTPTVDPTVDPTTEPTVDPTTPPTEDPTEPPVDPTIDPTEPVQPG